MYDVKSENMSHSYDPIPSKVFTIKVATTPINDFITNMDFENREKSKKTYRLPSYQRCFSKSIEWQQTLIESILEGLSIGIIIVSQWVHCELDNQNIPIAEQYYNIEDGQSRLYALYNFKNGCFRTKYGYYDDVKEQFIHIPLWVKTIEKANSQIRDSLMFKTMCHNFQLLQEGTSLSSNDLYCACIESDLVNYTISLINETKYSNKLQHFMGMDKIDKTTKKGRRHISNAIALTSGILYGLDYSNVNYHSHIPILNIPLTDENKEYICNILDTLFELLTSVEQQYPKQKYEKFISLFQTPQVFVASVIHEIRENHFDLSKWIKIINTIRQESKNHDKSVRDYMEDTIYNELTPGQKLTQGQKRNCTKHDYLKRLEKINIWIQRSC